MDNDNKRQIEKLEAQIQQLQRTRQCLCEKLRELEGSFDEDNDDDEENCCNRGGPPLIPQESVIRSELSRRSGKSRGSCGTNRTGSERSECSGRSDYSRERRSSNGGKQAVCTCGKKKKKKVAEEDDDDCGEGNVSNANIEDQIMELVACARGRTGGNTDPRGPTARDRGLGRELVRERGCNVCPRRRPTLNACWASQLQRSKQSSSSIRNECDGPDDDDEEEETKPRTEAKCGCAKSKKSPKPPPQPPRYSEEDDAPSVACRSPDWPCDDLYKEVQPTSACPKTSPCDPRGLTAEERGYKRGLAQPTVDKTLDLKKYRAFMKKDPRGPPRCRGADPSLGRCDDDCDDDGACGPGSGPRTRCTGNSCPPPDSGQGCKEGRQCGSSGRGSRSVPMHPFEESEQLTPGFVTYPVQQVKCNIPELILGGHSVSEYVNSLKSHKNFEEVVSRCLQMLMVNAYGSPVSGLNFCSKPSMPSAPLVNFESETEDNCSKSSSKWTVGEDDSRWNSQQQYEITEVQEHIITQDRPQSTLQLMDNVYMDEVKINYVFNVPKYTTDYDDKKIYNEASRQTVPSYCQTQDDITDDFKINEKLLDRIQIMISEAVKTELESWARRAIISLQDDSATVDSSGYYNIKLKKEILDHEASLSVVRSHPEGKEEVISEKNLDTEPDNIGDLHSISEKEVCEKEKEQSQTVPSNECLEKTDATVTNDVVESANKEYICAEGCPEFSTPVCFGETCYTLPMRMISKRIPVPRKGVPHQRKNSRLSSPIRKITLPSLDKSLTPNTKIRLTQVIQKKKVRSRSGFKRLFTFRSEEDKVAELWTRSYEFCGT